MNNKINHPIQPLYKDEEGTIRFKENEIITYLLDKGVIDLNNLVNLDFQQSDWEQLYQLIGYSLSSYSTLTKVSDESYEAAVSIYNEGISDLMARNIYLQSMLKEIKVALKPIVSNMYRVHEDDLKIYD